MNISRWAFGRCNTSTSNPTYVYSMSPSGNTLPERMTFLISTPPLIFSSFGFPHKRLRTSRQFEAALSSRATDCRQSGVVPESGTSISSANSRASSAPRPALAASQHATGAAVRSEACAAVPANSRIWSISSWLGTSTRNCSAYALIHSIADVAMKVMVPSAHRNAKSRRRHRQFLAR